MRYHFLGNPQRTGEYPDQGPGDKVSILWKTKKHYKITTESAVCGNYIILNEEDRLTVLDRTTGQELHTLDTPGHTTTAVIDNNIAYFGNKDRDHTLYALDLNNGEILWRRQLFSDSYYFCSPLLIKDVLYVTNGKTLYAIDIHNTKLWSIGFKHHVYGYELVASKNSIFVLTERTKSKPVPGHYTTFHCIDIQTGQLQWSSEQLVEIEFPPSYKDNRLYFKARVENSSGVYDLNTKSQKMTLRANAEFLHPPRLVSPYKKYLIVNDPYQHYALNNKTNEVEWYEDGGGLEGITFAGGNLYLYSDDLIEVISPDTGELKYQYNLSFMLGLISIGGSNRPMLTVHGQQLFCSDDEGFCYCLG